MVLDYLCRKAAPEIDMNKTFLIDAHEDIAYNVQAYGRDYRRSVSETRQREKDTSIPAAIGDTLLGWEEYQLGQVALIFGTIFTMSRRYQAPQWGTYAYSDTAEAMAMLRSQIDTYHRLTDSSPDQFRLITTLAQLEQTLSLWREILADYPQITHPTGIILSIESAEGIDRPEDIEVFWEAGVRIIGPVWAGCRFCGGTLEPGAFTKEGYRLLDLMEQFGYALDISHMNEESALQALEVYTGCVIASHANVRSLLKEDPHQRHLSDDAIRSLIDHDGVMGIIPYNGFLKTDWKQNDNREDVRLDQVIAHIDYVCQLAGNANHVGIGSDFDGGFGFPNVPLEINTIADLQLLYPMLQERGYAADDIHAIFHGNWIRKLTQTLSKA